MSIYLGDWNIDLAKLKNVIWADPETLVCPECMTEGAVVEAVAAVWACNVCGPHWLAAKMAEPTILVEWPCCGEVEVVRPGGEMHCPNCGIDDDVTGMAALTWDDLKPTGDGGLTRPATMPNPYGHIDTTPQKQWTPEQIAHGKNIAKAIGG